MLLLVLLPVFAFVLGQVVDACGGAEALFRGGGRDPVVDCDRADAPLRKAGVFYGVMAALLVGIVAVNIVRAKESAAEKRDLLQALRLTRR